MKHYLDLIQQTLTIPAAEYVPAIGDVFDIIKEARAAIQQEEVPSGWKLLKDTTQEERSWPEDYPHENGRYCNDCVTCLRQFIGHKRRNTCKVCDSPSNTRQQEAGNIDGVKVVPWVRRQECAATGAGHHDGPYGPLRQAQCYYCGEKPSDSSQEKS